MGVTEPICLLLLLLHSSTLSWIPSRTKGQVWPLPKYIASRNSIMYLNTSTFSVEITGHTCLILEEAVKRYKKMIDNTLLHSLKDAHSNYVCDEPQVLKSVKVQLNNPCEDWPQLKMEEQYELHADTSSVTANISSDSVWGALRGLETFSQLVYPASNSSCLVINNTDILDYPRFKHRGLLLDTSRHYLPVSIVYNIISAMEMNKMNVFHWHIVDDQSFPYQSIRFPNLSDKGAYDSNKLIYTQEDVRNIIEHARMRGIRVIPEFDSPGHTQSWGKGVDKLLTPCYTGKVMNGMFGPVDPSRSQNYKFIKTLFQELRTVFPDKYIHIGGDEVDYSCWMSNPGISAFMEEKNISTYHELEAYYIKNVLNITNQVNASGIVWQEVFQHNAELRNDTIVHIWTGNRRFLLNEVTKKGYWALLSEGWYLDHIEKQWQDYYLVDPADFDGNKTQTKLVLGGEACMWGEMVDETNIESRIWPRASAAAERLWSSKKVSIEDEAGARLNEHVCRMKRRGVPAQPANGPGFCPY